LNNGQNIVGVNLFLKAVALVTDEALVEPVALRVHQAFCPFCHITAEEWGQNSINSI
jgi:hypothetical protein